MQLQDKSRCEKSFTCIACLGEESFYDKIKKEARTITEEITHAFEGGHSLSQSEMQDLFFNFCETVDVLNRLVMYRDLKPMWPLLLRILQYQDTHKLECHLTALQAVRFHAESSELHSELVRTVARINARCIQTNHPREGISSNLVRRPLPTLGVALYDVHGVSPILQLLSTTLLSLLNRAKTREDLSVHIIATQKPNLEEALVRDLYMRFSDAGCWHDVWDAVTPKTTVLPEQLSKGQQTKIRNTLRALGITTLFDCIGSSAQGSEAFCGLFLPGHEGHFDFDYLNSAVLPSNPRVYSAVILDPVLRAAVPDDDATNKVCCISCWQPPVMDCIRNLNRSKRPLFREATGEKFGIHPPVNLARISPQVLESVLALLIDLPRAILYLYGAPSTQISATLRNMQSYAQRRGLDKNYFDGRVEWWGHLPMEDHGQRIRDKVHVCLAFGPSTGHTGVNLALCVGVPVVTEEGLCGGGDISSWVPTSMLRMVGLGALAVPNGSGLAGRLVKQLYHDGELLSTVQDILDNQATSSTGFFDPERTANDLAELVIAHHHSSDSDPPARDFISRHAEPPFFALDQNGMLQPTARVVMGEGEDHLATP
jgi:hypothetical protein